MRVISSEEILLKVASFTVIVEVVGCHEDLERRVDLIDLQNSTEVMCPFHYLVYFLHHEERAYCGFCPNKS
jgi:hypothetical protein